MAEVCSRCKRELPISEFYTGQRGYWCKDCRREVTREYHRRVRATPEGLEKSREYHREYYRKLLATPEGREKSRERSRKYLATPEGREKSRKNSREYHRRVRATPEGLEKSRKYSREYHRKAQARRMRIGTLDSDNLGALRRAARNWPRRK